MNFSDSTFEALSAYERFYKTAIEGNWCPNPGLAALQVMHDALDAHDGRVTTLNHNCATCQLSIVKRAGYMYFADKAERAKAPAAAPKPARTRKGAKTTPKTKTDE